MNQKYSNEENRKALARTIAQEAMVLLKNEDRVLPLAEGKCAALLGRTQIAAIIGGGGSGASFSKGTLDIREELRKAGLNLASATEAFYQELAARAAEEAAKNKGAQDDFFKNLEGLVSSGMIYELFGRYSPAAPEEVPEDAVFKALGVE